MAALEARQQAIVADRGGEDVVGAVLLGQIERHCKLELVESTLWLNLQQHGTTTGKGRTRAAATLWLAVVDRLQKSAVAIGLDRRAKPVSVGDLL